MRRFAPAAVIAVLALAVTTPVNAGYLIIRVILDGSGGGSVGGGEGGPGGLSPGGLSPGGPGPGGRQGYGGSGQQRPGGGGLSGPPPQPMGGPGPGGEGGLMGGGGAGAGEFAHDPTRSLVVVIPIEEDLKASTAFYSGRGTNSATNPTWRPKLHMNHRGQKLVANLFNDNATVQWYDPLLKIPSPLKTRVTEIRDQHHAWTKSSKSDPKQLFTVLTRALEAGAVEDAMKYADELLAFSTGKEGLPPEITAFARAYKVMQGGIKSPPARPSAAEQWKVRLGASNVHTQGHYSIVFWADSATTTEVQRRASMLDEHFKGFFLWHATRGIELPIPDAPLIAILPKSGEAVFGYAKALDGPARLSADGFYAPDHDLLVLSPERVDEIGQTFARQVRQIYSSTVSRTTYLEGKTGPDIHVNGQNGKKRPEEVARMQTLALVDRLLEDEATVAAITREGSRQLLYATRQLPRYVQLPEWLNHGSANFFTRPKDPAFITDAEGKTSMAVAIATGYGGPNYVLQRYFKDLYDKKELNADRAALLKNVLTDAYFRGLRDPKEANDPDPVKADGGLALSSGAGGNAVAGGARPPMGYGGTGYGGPRLRPGGQTGPGVGGSADGPGPGLAPGPGFGGLVSGQLPTPTEDDPIATLRKKRDRLGIKAQSTAWALYYYLAKEHPDKLKSFLGELATLPRDLPLDGDTVTALFCKSFGLDGSKESLNRFANSWLESVRAVPPAAVVPDIPLVEPKQAATNPMGPGGLFPGGRGGSPDGGDR